MNASAEFFISERGIRARGSFQQARREAKTRTREQRQFGIHILRVSLLSSLFAGASGGKAPLLGRQCSFVPRAQMNSLPARNLIFKYV